MFRRWKNLFKYLWWKDSRLALILQTYQCEEFWKSSCLFSSSEVKCEVQIDQSIVGKRRKYNSRGKSFNRHWNFGHLNHKCHIEIVQDRPQSTLENIIINHADKDTKITIYSIRWTVILRKTFRERLPAQDCHLWKRILQQRRISYQFSGKCLHMESNEIAV